MEFVSPDDNLAGYVRWFSSRPQVCMVCENNADPDQITLVLCEQSEPTFLQTCADLGMSPDKAAHVADVTRDPDFGRGYLLPMCSSCLQLSGMLGDMPRKAFITLADFADQGAAVVRSKPMLMVHDPLPPAFWRRQA